MGFSMVVRAYRDDVSGSIFTLVSKGDDMVGLQIAVTAREQKSLFVAVFTTPSGASGNVIANIRIALICPVR